MAANRNRKLTGTVLAGVMWLLVLMMAILAVGAQNSRLDSRISLSSVEKIRCKWLCRAGAETALAYLKDDLKDVDSLLDEWAITNEDLQNVQLTNGTYTVTITDECSKLNLNTASANQLLNLDTQGMNGTITDSIQDWRDTDEEVRTSGAESGYYLNLPVGYICRNGNFRTPREVLRVRGMTEDLFYGKENRILGQGGWSRFLTCYSAVNNVDAAGNKRLNVNTADETELTSKLSISQAQARWIVQNRSFQKLADLLGSSGGSSQSGNASQSGNTSQRGNSSSGNSAGSSGGQGQSAPRSMNSPVQAPVIFQIPQFSTVAALLAADESASGSEQSGQRGQDGRSSQGGRGGQDGQGQGDGSPGGRRGQDGQGRQGGPGGSGGRRGQDGQGGQGRGRGGQGGGRNRMGPGRSPGGGGGQRQSANQTQPLDWATLSRIFDQITLTDNTTISGQININTVGIDVLRAFLEGNDELAAKIIAYRESMGGEIANVFDLIKIDGMTQDVLKKYLDQLCVRSSVYTIRATAQSGSCGIQYFIEMAVNRDREGREVLYKLEGVGN